MLTLTALASQLASVLDPSRRGGTADPPPVAVVAASITATPPPEPVIDNADAAEPQISVTESPSSPPSAPAAMPSLDPEGVASAGMLGRL